MKTLTRRLARLEARLPPPSPEFQRLGSPGQFYRVRSFAHPRFVKADAAGVVENDAIFLADPQGRTAYAPRSLHLEAQAARLPAPNQQLLKQRRLRRI